MKIRIKEDALKKIVTESAKRILKEGFWGSDSIEERAMEMIQNGFEYGYIEDGDAWDDLMEGGTYSDIYTSAEKLSEEYDINIDEALNYLHKAFNEYNELYENKNMENNLVKINENTLKQIVKESVNNVIKEALLGDTEPDENGNIFMNGNQIFDEIDKQLSRFGDAHISRFYSDDGNVVVAVHRDIYGKCKNEIKGIMSEYSYSFYDVGADGDYAMMTFKSEPGLTLGENKIKIGENDLKTIVSESVKRIMNKK